MGTASSVIAENLPRVRERIARAAARAGRRAEEITLVAVTKTHPVEAIRDAWEAGVRHFGENRVQEWETKHAHLNGLDATWHLVGHLQSNKVRRAARLFHCVDSVDSVSLAQKLDAAVLEVRREEGEEGSKGGKGGRGDPGEQDRGESGKRLEVLIEVRVSPEQTKTGVEEAGLAALAAGVLTLPHLDLGGLMCIPPFFEDAEKARPYFRRLRELRDALRGALKISHPESAAADEGSLLPELSMGMSHDFEVAIEEGATQVRIGTALFGARGAA
jgi:uncharacterized pyridoxal phosphate-containing UPF0001 family protein